MRILIAMGTRPEIIKLGPVYLALSQIENVQPDVFWTGQHEELANGLFELFKMEVAHHAVHIMEEPGLAGKFGLMNQQIEQKLRGNAYDWIVVQGDTMTATAAATAGFLNRVPVAHVEAGLRSGDLQSPWPEEFDRRVISLSAARHFAPTAVSRNNLLREGVPLEQIVVTGNTGVDALLYVLKKVRDGYEPLEPGVAALPPDKKLILATLHRRENIGEPLAVALRALRRLGEDGDKVIALPVHCNPEVRAQVFDSLDGAENVRLLPPLQYPDLVYLLSRAWAIVSDSGGLQEEAATFGLHILIARNTTERPEAVEAGFGRLVGANYDAIVNGVRSLTAGDKPQLVRAKNPYGRGNAAQLIARNLTAHRQRRHLAAAG